MVSAGIRRPPGGASRRCVPARVPAAVGLAERDDAVRGPAGRAEGAWRRGRGSSVPELAAREAKVAEQQRRASEHA